MTQPHRLRKPAGDRIIVIVGTRPEAIKLAPVILALRDLRIQPLVCMTGQHDALAADALGQFNITADVTLSLLRQGQSLRDFNARAIVALAALFAREAPDWVVVQGDTSSALCATIAAQQAGIAVAHVEAGLRSFNRREPFPEEIYRTAISRLAQLHFAPTQGARANLLAESIANTAIAVTGNTIVDALRMIQRQSPPTSPNSKQLILVTMHRRENHGAGFENVVAALAELAARHDVEIIVPVHPSAPSGVFAPLAVETSVRLVAPMTYAAFTALLLQARLVITDSGGVQEEASILGVPTLVARRNTERPEVVESGTARIVGTNRADIVNAAVRLLDDPAVHRRMAQPSLRLGDGNAGLRIAGRLQHELMTRQTAV